MLFSSKNQSKVQRANFPRYDFNIPLKPSAADPENESEAAERGREKREERREIYLWGK